MSYKCEHEKDSDICAQCWEESNLEPRIETMNPSNNTQLKSAEEWIEEFPILISYEKKAFVVDYTKHIKQIQLNAYKAGMTEACKVVQQRADDYDAEHGHTDMETGTREYPKHGDDYMLELTEIIETIAEARDKKETL